jgi:hypothetical protein
MITLDLFHSLLTLLLEGWAGAVPCADKEFRSSHASFLKDRDACLFIIRK